MALYKKLDLWSISDGLDKMMDYCYNGNVKNSPYWDHYCDQINELCNAAADMYNELQDIKNFRNRLFEEYDFITADILLTGEVYTSPAFVYR